ncbi:MAG: hypothetical protein ACPG5P_00795 [Saprospiraceae bacterium]
MNSIRLTNILRFIILVLIQVLVLQNIRIGNPGSIWESMHIIVYPIFILLLPFETKKWVLVLLGFLIGIMVDIFYGTMGVHAAAGTLTGFIRPIILKLQEPKGGHGQQGSPTKYRLGLASYARYTGIMLLIHLVWYFSMQYFSVAYIYSITTSTLLSFVFSFPLVIAHAVAANPKN